MRIIDGRTIETECDSCACTFTCGRGEDGEPDEILCSECKQTWQELRAELAKERDRVWFETFLSFPFKALPAPMPQFSEAELHAIDLDVADANEAELHRCRQCQRWTDSVEALCSRCRVALILACEYCGSPNHEEHYCPEIEDLWRQGVPHYE